MIIRGKDKGETGTIKCVIRSQNRVIVEGKNLIKKHFTVEAPFHASNVQVVDPITGRPCKVGVKYLEDGTKVRVARGTGTFGFVLLLVAELMTAGMTLVGRRDDSSSASVVLLLRSNSGFVTRFNQLQNRII